MAIETDIYTAVWNHFRSYRNSELSYVQKNGWFKSNIDNIPLMQLPAITLYPIDVGEDERQGGGDRFTMSLAVRGSIQHFDIMESPEGVTGRKGILDLYYNLDRVLFTMFPRTAVTVNDVTTTTRLFPIFASIDAVRDIIIDRARFTTETYNDDYPNIDVIIPFDIWYVKTDEVRYIS